MKIYIMGNQIFIRKPAMLGSMPYGVSINLTAGDFYKGFPGRNQHIRYFPTVEEAERYSRDYVKADHTNFYVEKCPPIFEVEIKNFFLEKAVQAYFDSKFVPTDEATAPEISCNDIFKIISASVAPPIDTGGSRQEVKFDSFKSNDYFFSEKSYVKYRELLPSKFALFSIAKMQPLVKEYLGGWGRTHSNSAQKLSKILQSGQTERDYSEVISLISIQLKEIQNLSGDYYAMLKAMIDYLDVPLFYLHLLEQLTSIPKAPGQIVIDYLTAPKMGI